MSTKHCLPLFLLLTLFTACKNGQDKQAAASAADSTRLNAHPGWIQQGNIYEVNVRQYTPEGTFQAFAKHLDRLKEMGVQTLWFMPVNPISKADRKGSLGSYYAISDYTSINPEFGAMDDWKALVKQAHEKGFRIMIDWVPNHTGADHYWLQKHPGFFVRDSSGKAVSQFDWTDTRKLNFQNAELRDTMISQMKYWVTETGIDGFRCDYAVGPTRAFWKDCITALKAARPDLFMLAEADSSWLHTVGFDATYAWPEFNMMKLIASGKRKANAFDSVIAQTDTSLPADGIRLFFTSNHDENSWNKADFATMPGASHAPFAVLTQTIKRSVPLVYSGQEEPVLRAIKFFDKDTMGFAKFERAPLYKQLLELRRNNPALAANASFKKIVTDKDDQVYAYYRKAGGHTVIVLLNLGKTPQHVMIGKDDMAVLSAEGSYAYLGEKAVMKTIPAMYDLKAWGYLVISE
ncbi:MAG: alpha-amylase [Sediminibacterium sp.]|nr:alpha-amylase [Sediminibacterium sp.]